MKDRRRDPTDLNADTSNLTTAELFLDEHFPGWDKSDV